MLLATFVTALLSAGVTAPFAPALPFGPGHRGVDFEATAGQAITSPISGEVTYVGYINSVGTITISFGTRKMTLQPVIPLATRGEKVKRGEVIARVSNAKYHCSNCIHIGVRESGRYINPTFLSESSLLPVGLSSWIADH